MEGIDGEFALAGMRDRRGWISTPAAHFLIDFSSFDIWGRIPHAQRGLKK
jgi:hypothetical protein